MKLRLLLVVVVGIGALVLAARAHAAPTCEERLKGAGFEPTLMRPGETRNVEGYAITVRAPDSAPALCERINQLKDADAQKAARIDQAETARLAAEAKVSKQLTAYGFLLNHVLEISGIAVALVFLISGVLIGRATKNGRRN